MQVLRAAIVEELNIRLAEIAAGDSSNSLALRISSGLEKSGSYRRDDLWVLSSSPNLDPAEGETNNRSQKPWLAVARSLWHGPNKDGKMHIEQVGPWFDNSAASEEANPMCIIFGPFGSGKSQLLVAMISFLVEQMKANGHDGLRILVAAHTNAAVDRVLVGLLDRGFTDLLRVGPLRRIDRRLLAHSLHATQVTKGPSEAVSELQAMLQEAISPSDTASIQAELDKMKQGAEQRRKQLLKTVRVVGLTCCSAMLPVMNGLSFDTVVLDECSQITEPLSIVPLVRSSTCRHLLIAGDPCQLPPIISSPAQVTPSGIQPLQNPSEAQHGLGRPLFARLCALGHKCILLRRQYRCHPTIAAVANRQYYKGQLLDGCTEESRAPLMPGLQPLAFLDVRGQTQGGGMSLANKTEAACVVSALCQILQAGISAEAVGVICLYRAQVALVQSLMRKQVTDGGEDCSTLCSIDVATVDSFQGMEKDIIVLTTAVTRPSAFAADAQRLNVALTRAKHHLILIGCDPALQALSPALRHIIGVCRSGKGTFLQGGLGFKLINAPS
ncbi:hypothetical protein WJX73_004434 [Symbiochloris irregularis]|uniref:Uncharacterized protein n=1 Tax=Symbiochloris irregularis TaxID=706552 RepID=A0AAW1NZU3_9CHLO